MMPPSPFHRPVWRRFAEDTWPRIVGWGRRFWASPIRWPTLGVMALVAVAALFASARQTQAVVGRVLDAEGKPVQGAQIHISWYATARAAIVGPATSAAIRNETEDVLEERVVREATVSTGPDGRFAADSERLLVWPTSSGPFVRIRLDAPDPLSGQMYVVRRFFDAADGSYPGMFDSRRQAGEWATAIDPIRLAPSGRILDIAVDRDQVLTAEETGGVRLFRLNGDRLELTAHRLAGRGGAYRSAAFAGDDIVIIRDGAAEVANRKLEVPSAGIIEGDYDRLLGATASQLILGNSQSLEVFKRVSPPQLVEDYLLGDPQDTGLRLGPEMAMLHGSRFLHLHSEGSVRLLELGSSFRSPTTLVEQGGRVTEFSLIGDQVLLASIGGVTLYDLGGTLSARKLGWLELDTPPLALLQQAVLSEAGVTVLEVSAEEGDLSIARTIPMRIEPLEAGSALLYSTVLVLPELGEVTTRPVEIGLRRDPILGTSKVQSRVVRDSAVLSGARLVNLTTGKVETERLAAPVRLLLRQDGANRALVAAALVDGRVLYAGADARLFLHRWTEVEAAPAGP